MIIIINYNSLYYIYIHYVNHTYSSYSQFRSRGSTLRSSTPLHWPRPASWAPTRRDLRRCPGDGRMLPMFFVTGSSGDWNR